MSSHLYTDRATSAGYRLPASTRISSAYHTKCIPKQQTPSVQQRGHAGGAAGASGGAVGGAPGPGGGRHTRADFRSCNVVIEDQTWRETVWREKKGQIRWDEGWGFLRDYDRKGNPKQPKETPENLSYYSETVPSTANQRFGHRQKTGAAKAMVDLQHRLSTTNRKKHNKELICYD